MHNSNTNLQKFAFEMNNQWPNFKAFTKELSTHSNCPGARSCNIRLLSFCNSSFKYCISGEIYINITAFCSAPFPPSPGSDHSRRGLKFWTEGALTQTLCWHASRCNVINIPIVYKENVSKAGIAQCHQCNPCIYDLMNIPYNGSIPNSCENSEMFCIIRSSSTSFSVISLL